MAPIEKHAQTVQILTELNSANSFTLRDDESRIIAVMFSNVDDSLGAEVMNCVLQQFLVGTEERCTFRFLWARVSTRRTYSCRSQRQHRSSTADHAC